MAMMCPLQHAEEKKGLCLHEKMMIGIGVLALAVIVGVRIFGI